MGEAVEENRLELKSSSFPILKAVGQRFRARSWCKQGWPEGEGLCSSLEYGLRARLQGKGGNNRNKETANVQRKINCVKKTSR